MTSTSAPPTELHDRSHGRTRTYDICLSMTMYDGISPPRYWSKLLQIYGKQHPTSTKPSGSLDFTIDNLNS